MSEAKSLINSDLLDTYVCDVSDMNQVNKVCEDVLKKYPDYIEQFYNAAAVIINRSYKAPINAFEDVDDDLPF